MVQGSQLPQAPALGKRKSQGFQRLAPQQMQLPVQQSEAFRGPQSFPTAEPDQLRDEPSARPDDPNQSASPQHLQSVQPAPLPMPHHDPMLGFGEQNPDFLSSNATGPPLQTFRDPPPQNTSTGVFGVPLEELYAMSGVPVPLVVQQCIQAVDLFGLEVEGIYRLSGNANHINQLREAFSARMTPPLLLLTHNIDRC
jgi:Rho GTPase-activating protein RGD1